MTISRSCRRGIDIRQIIDTPRDCWLIQDLSITSSGIPIGIDVNLCACGNGSKLGLFCVCKRIGISLGFIGSLDFCTRLVSSGSSFNAVKLGLICCRHRTSCRCCCCSDLHVRVSRCTTDCYGSCSSDSLNARSSRATDAIPGCAIVKDPVPNSSGITSDTSKASINSTRSVADIQTIGRR